MLTNLASFFFLHNTVFPLRFSLNITFPASIAYMYKGEHEQTFINHLTQHIFLELKKYFGIPVRHTALVNRVRSQSGGLGEMKGTV